jgi:Dolichyl-phosphate-mannose-protein mannosyltransferase
MGQVWEHFLNAMRTMLTKSKNPHSFSARIFHRMGGGQGDASGWIILGAFLSCAFQLSWFIRKCLHNADFDGISYIGIARHIGDGNLRASINAFRSPLFSWLIALGSLVTGNLLIFGKWLTIGSFLGCAVVLYFLTRYIWHSRMAAAIAVLWLTLSRGVIALSVQFVTPDFLFTLLVLGYYTLLLYCLRHKKRRGWLILGAIHAIAFLAKAIALPWLAFTTLISVLFSFEKRVKEALLCFFIALLLPLLVSVAWAAVLQSKYGVLTTGSQFKANLLQWVLKERFDDPQQNRYLFLRDLSGSFDRYVVDDPMPPGAASWRYPAPFARVIPKAILAEIRNTPSAVKELTILMTPGGVVIFLLGTVILGRNRKRHPAEFHLALIISIGSLSLILAYCMLVFDGRYVLPLAPLLIAMSVRFLLPQQDGVCEQPFPAIWRKLLVTALCMGAFFCTVYWASPLRSLNRDFQLSCYDAGRKLRLQAGVRVISIGEGPYPEHGVGWEAGFYAAFFGDREIVAENDKLPSPEMVSPAIADVELAAPDALLVWGKPKDLEYVTLVHGLRQQKTDIPSEKILDPVAGEVGTIFFPKHSLSDEVKFNYCRKSLKNQTNPPPE